jgi:hypothetical protein
MPRPMGSVVPSMTGGSESVVFVAYPWAPYDRDDYKARYRRLEEKYRAQFVFAEDRLTSDHLITKIESMMVAADFCVFDLTDLNPNVTLEYGLARGLRLESYIAFNPKFSQRDVPSDLKGFDSLRYESLDELEERLDPFLAQVLAAEERRRRARKPQLPSRDQEQFDAEFARLPRGDILAKIDSRGHWFLRLRPERYEPGRVEFRKLMDLIADSKVKHRSYSFPHTDTLNQFPELALEWYGREFDMSFFKESWRVFQSGQFVQRRAMPEDWPEEWSMPAPKSLVSGKTVMPQGAAAHIAEALELAARFAAALPGSDGLVFRLIGSPMASRELFVTPSQDDIALDFEVKGRRTVMEAFVIDRTFSRDELRASWSQIAEHQVTEFFDRFGFNLEGQRLRRWVYLPG